MRNQIKALLAYREVKKSETDWVRKPLENLVFYYKGGLSGRFLIIEREGRVKFGCYDGACPSIEDAVLTYGGSIGHATTESALREIEKIIGETLNVQNAIRN